MMLRNKWSILEMWATILKGKAEKLMPKEIEDLHSEFNE
jgi:hypothetical protein